MRSRAEAAHWVDFEGKADWVGHVAVLDPEADDREHIAGMSPVVALAVADWLDTEAAEYERWSADDLHVPCCSRSWREALVVARAYVGGEPRE